jgi:hypothetical protein
MAGTPLDNLVPNSPGSYISADLVSFSFTDLSGLSAGTIDGVDIGTDANGNITSWGIEGLGAGITLTTNYGISADFDQATVCVPIGGGSCHANSASIDTTDDPGTWTMSTTTTSPEPSTNFLLGTGLLGLLALGARKRIAV